jgi:hypothetical protein
MATATKPFPLISKADASYVFWPETEYRCQDECINLKSVTECAILGTLVQINAPAGSCDYYIHGGLTDWKMPVTGCITKESAGYAENPSKQGFGCKRCKWFDADSLDCYRGVDKESAGPAPGIIHPNGCCNLNEPDAKRGKMTRAQLVTLFETKGFSEAARLSRSDDMAAKLNPGIQAVALKVQEAMVHSDVRARLADAVNDAHRGTGEYGYYVDHTGDGESGDVIYSSGGDIRKAPYEIGSQGGKAVANIDMDSSTNVVPMTTYQEEADDDDHYASMTEAFVKAKLYTELPVYERFISKGERDAASADDFAGKGKSFPILKPGDVQAAVHAMGRAGSDNVGASTLKSRIIAIAKRKGWTQYLPKAWRGDDSAKESAIVSRGTKQTMDLLESAATLEPIVLREARADYEIKLIAPGKGSSAFYPKEVLQRDGPKVFKAGTHVYLNHPTQAEESARPEGDVKNLAGVLSSDAVYHESHAKGPGLYARMKVFADHGQLVEEKAPHVGMSIRASGVAESGIKKDGLPILKELTHAESVDVVTRAGAGGMILTESARTNQEGEMTLQEAQKLIDEGIKSATQPLLERALRADAKDEALNILEGARLPDAAKRKIVENSLRSIPKTDAGALDSEAFRKIVVAEATSVAEMLSEATGAGRVFGMGPSATIEDPEKVAAREKADRKALKRLHESEQDVFGRLMGNKQAAEFAANKKVA